ncbi:MAG: aspartate ammonia-lyase, partial [Candidatus Atribacteria bacterium]
SLFHSQAITTALTPHIGYHKAAELANLMKEKKYDIVEANIILKVIEEDKLKEILKPGNLLKLGFSLEDLK